MAVHHPTKDVIGAAVDLEVAPDPFDAAAKAQLIIDCDAAASAELTSAGFTEAEGSLVVTIDGSDIMWFDYNHESTAYRCRAPLRANLYVLVGGEV